ncbi:EcsC family protein [Azotobacter chroococcum subsp. isscasi]|uniref:EcsC family protein n=1 Tax=Azotobacter chroococcum TaxID=353 RepID=UPI00103CBCC1|nr:EcsC family protein [Azotobacter chroococcum]TBW10956.1 EcsC family protein [Azotobacter chroococcum subsp. isscasi]
MNQHSEYETRALKQIHIWKNPERTWLDGAVAVINWPLEKAGDAVMKVPGLSFAIQKSFTGILGVINDGSQWSVRPEAILKEYEKTSDTKITNLRDIYNFDLSVVDRTIGWLDTKYEGLALIEGAAAGGASVLSPAAALIAIPADIAALLTLNLRAIGEYATYCGFDISLPQERLFALNVLTYASSSTDQSKQIALAQLVRIARDVALRKTWKDLEKHLFVQAVKEIAQTLSIRLTKAKLANVIPAAGAVLGGGFNAYYTDKVCKAAFYLYRERFLAEKYGANDIEITVPPAEEIVPHFNEQIEHDDTQDG